MNRARLAHLPPIPATVNVNIPPTWATSHRGNRFLLTQNEHWQFIIFATDEQLGTLAACSTVYVDATFRSCPRPFHQFLTVHGFYQDRVIALVFVLMGQRLVGNYTHIFQDLKRKIFELTANQWQPRLFISDFETAIRTALHAEFPGVTVHGCYYHFCAAVWKKARELNITGPGSRALLGQHWPARYKLSFEN